MLETQLSIDAATYNWDVPTAMDIAGMQRTLLRLTPAGRADPERKSVHHDVSFHSHRKH